MKDVIDVVGFAFIMGVCWWFLTLPESYNKARPVETGPAIYGP